MDKITHQSEERNRKEKDVTARTKIMDFNT